MTSDTNLAYFSHSYRKEDAGVVSFFLRLMLSEGIVASIDPPSDTVNAAKLERHLNATDGMLAILTWRGGGVSPHILFEIRLCLRARKPLLVFIEDMLSDALIPARVLQGRFSRISYFRQIREHRRALQSFKAYLGDKARYQPSIYRRSCLILGADGITKDQSSCLSEWIEQRNYQPQMLSRFAAEPAEHDLLEIVNRASFALSFVDDKDDKSSYYRGLVWGAMIPTIALTANDGYQFVPDVPREYQPRLMPHQAPNARDVIDKEIDVFQEEFFDPDTQQQAQAYMEMLVDQASPEGRYSARTRSTIFQGVNYIMGDTYNTGQAGAVGPGALAQHIHFGNAWQQIGDTTNLNVLADELSRVRAAARLEPESTERDATVGQLALAEGDARKGDGAGALQRLSGVGKWALELASKIGADVAVKAIQSAMGLG